MDTNNSYVVSSSNDALLLAALAEDEGFDNIDDLVEHFALKEVQPGICICRATTTRCEPAMREGACHNCGENTVQSVGSLSGMC